MGTHDVEPVVDIKILDVKLVLPNNQGQFGESVATQAFVPLRATQRVQVRPVVLRRVSIAKLNLQRQD